MRTHDLAGRFNEGMHQSLINALLLLRKEALELTKEVQQNGRWHDLAEERWIFELADIYENIFSRPARVSGSGDGELEQRGDYYRLLVLSLPSSFPRHGKLWVKQIDRTKIEANLNIPLAACQAGRSNPVMLDEGYLFTFQLLGPFGGSNVSSDLRAAGGTGQP
jgi:hypothetical protein